MASDLDIFSEEAGLFLIFDITSSFSLKDLYFRWQERNRSNDLKLRALFDAPPPKEDSVVRLVHDLDVEIKDLPCIVVFSSLSSKKYTRIPISCGATEYRDFFKLLISAAQRSHMAQAHNRDSRFRHNWNKISGTYSEHLIDKVEEKSKNIKRWIMACGEIPLALVEVLMPLHPFLRSLMSAIEGKA